MKVKIGNFPTKHWSVMKFERWWFEKTHSVEWYLDVHIDDYTLLDKIVSRLCNIVQYVFDKTVNKIISKRTRKIDVRIDYFDTWSMDQTLAHIIIPMLVQLRATKHGVPCIDIKDIPKVKNSNLNTAEQQWDWILSEMIWTFEQIIDEDDGESYYMVPYKDEEEVNRTRLHDMDGNVRYLLSEEEAKQIGKFDKVLFDKYQKRLDNGLRLFGKYYRSLWD